MKHLGELQMRICFAYTCAFILCEVDGRLDKGSTLY